MPEFGAGGGPGISAAPDDLANIRAELNKITVGKDDYLVITVHQRPMLRRDQAEAILHQVQRALPQLQGRVIIKPSDITVESKPREEVKADANVPPWLR